MNKLFLLVIFCFIYSNSNGQSAVGETVELEQLIRGLFPNNSKYNSRIDWESIDMLSLPITWDDSYRTYGKAIVSIKGETINCYNNKKIEENKYPCNWDIRLNGDSLGYSKIQIGSIMAPEFPFDEDGAVSAFLVLDNCKAEYLTSSSSVATANFVLYKVQFENDKVLYFKKTLNCGGYLCHLTIDCEIVTDQASANEQSHFDESYPISSPEDELCYMFGLMLNDVENGLPIDKVKKIYSNKSKELAFEIGKNGSAFGISITDMKELFIDILPKKCDNYNELLKIGESMQ